MLRETVAEEQRGQGGVGWDGGVEGRGGENEERGEAGETLVGMEKHKTTKLAATRNRLSLT